MMIRNRLIQKYSLFAFLMMFIFIILGLGSGFFLMRLLAPMPQIFPHLFIARLVDKLDNGNKVEAIKIILEAQNSTLESNIELIDEQGRVIFPENKTDVSYILEKLQQLEKPYDFIFSEDPPGGLRPPPFLPGPPLPRSMIVRLQGSPNYYIKVSPPRPLEADRPNMRWIGILVPLTLVISLLLGVGLTILMVYNSVSKQVRIADQVISELQSGNLKARFPIARKDEFGKAMQRFNKMADEIERLVETLKKGESARTKFLQELAHDLRTPISSLKGLLETLNNRSQEMSEEKKKEFLTLSSREVDYVARLVEDLLFLAQVTEPKYNTKSVPADLVNILNEEVYDAEFREAQKQNRRVIRKNYSEDPIKIFGDPHLLQRLFRNAFENACSFAKAGVNINIIPTDDGHVKIVIDDDGPGFSQEDLEHFGERRLTRALDKNRTGRVSIGLGSVAMKAICAAHRGSLKVTNRLNEKNEVVGGRLEIILPV